MPQFNLLFQLTPQSALTLMPTSFLVLDASVLLLTTALEEFASNAPSTPIMILTSESVVLPASPTKFSTL
jgi:hypothetical protein